MKRKAMIWGGLAAAGVFVGLLVTSGQVTPPAVTGPTGPTGATGGTGSTGSQGVPGDIYPEKGRSVTTGGASPTKVYWYVPTDAGVLDSGDYGKLITTDILYGDAGTISTITTKRYAADGVTVSSTYVDTVTYSGSNEASRTRSKTP